MLFGLSSRSKTCKRSRFAIPVRILLVYLRCAEAHDAAPPSDHFNLLSDFDLFEITYTHKNQTHVILVTSLSNKILLNAITSVDTTHDNALFAFVTSIHAEPTTKSIYIRRPMIGVEGCGSMSHGKKIQVSCDTSVTKVSTNGRPAGLA